MRIPSGLAGNPVALHGFVTAHNIFDGTAEYMVNTRLAIDGRRPFIKGVYPVRRSFFKTLEKYSVFIPVCQYFCFNSTVWYILWILNKFIVHYSSESFNKTSSLPVII